MKMTADFANPLLLVRAEAGAAIGTGHVMRMLALAQAWQDRGGRAEFLFAQPNEAMRLRVERENCAVAVLGRPSASLADAEAVAACAQDRHPAWIAVDGYDFQRDYLDIITKAAAPILLAADFAVQRRLPVAVILNQNPHAKPGDYAACAPEARLLLGLHYALLRREFRDWTTRRPARSGKISRILITLGGADPDNVTERVVRALAGRLPEGIRAKVLLGANNTHGSAVRAAVAQAGAQFEFLERAGDMPALLAESELAICAGGSTVWEMAFMGVPVLAIVLAENQAPLAAAVEELGCGINLGWHNKINFAEVGRSVLALAGDAARVADMSRRGQSLVDGEGAGRVADCLFREMKKQQTDKTFAKTAFPS